MNTLVTGGAGFIGSHLIKKLLKRGDRIICFDNFNDYYPSKIKEQNVAFFADKPNFVLIREDIEDYSVVKAVFKKYQITKVAHLAARAGVRPSIVNPFIYEKTNILGTLNLLEIAKNTNVSNFTFVSSSSVYGTNCKVPFSENDPIATPLSPYAATKRAAELLCYTYHHLYGLNVNIIRPFTIYGPSGRPDMAPFLFTKLIDQGRQITQFGNGSSKRDYTYIDDFIVGLVAALDQQFGFEIFNLGNSQSIALEKFIHIIEQELGKRASIKVEPMRPEDMPITCANIDKARKLLHYQPKTNIVTGMRKFIDWYRQNRQLYL